MNNIIARKFVSWEVPTLESQKDGEVYQLAEKSLFASPKLTREEKNKIAKLVSNYGHVKLHGWLYPFRELKTFYVEDMYGNVYKRRGHDKTAIRSAINGRIYKVTER